MKTVSLSTKGFLIFLIIILLASSLIFINRVFLGDSFGREEAQHGLYGLWIMRDIQSLDWNSFWYDTGRQMVWPFLNSWFLGIFFLIFGASMLSAKTLSFIFFLLSVFLVYILSLELCNKAGRQVGMIASLLMLSSPIIINYSVLNMPESFSAFLFLAAAYAYIIAEERKITLEFFLFAVLLGLLIYTNYIYAYLAIPSFLIAAVIKLGPISYEAYKYKKKGEKVAINFFWWGYRKLILFGVILLLAGIWFSFSFSRKILLLGNILFKYSGSVENLSFWQNVFYYPIAIIKEYSFSPVIGVLIVISLLLPLIARRYRDLNKLFVISWVALILLTFTIPSRNPRLFFVISSFSFIIFSTVLVYCHEKLYEKSKNYGKALILILLLLATPSLPRLYRTYFPERSMREIKSVLDFFKDNLPKGATIVMPVNLEHLNPDVIEFHLKDKTVKVLGPVRLDPMIGDYFLTIELEPDNLLRSEIRDDSIFILNLWLRSEVMRGGLNLINSQRFEKIGITAHIYSK